MEPAVRRLPEACQGPDHSQGFRPRIPAGATIRLPLIAIVGLLFYGEGWDVLILVGGAVIFSGNLINLWSERRLGSNS